MTAPMFRWWFKKQINTQNYRARLDAIVCDLRMALSDVSESQPKRELSDELNRLETAYRVEIRDLQSRSV